MNNTHECWRQQDLNAATSALTVSAVLSFHLNLLVRSGILPVLCLTSLIVTLISVTELPVVTWTEEISKASSWLAVKIMIAIRSAVRLLMSRHYISVICECYVHKRVRWSTSGERGLDRRNQGLLSVLRSIPVYKNDSTYSCCAVGKQDAIAVW